MAQKIAIAIGFEGGEEVRRQLEALGKAGEQAFKQIQDAAKKPVSDPAQIDRTKQAMNELAAAAAKLGPQFQALAASARQFGAEGEQASRQVTTSLNQTNVAAQQAGASIKQAAAQASGAGATAGSGLISAATAFKLAAVGIVAAITAVTDALTKGAVETGTAIAAQAEKLGLSIQQWLDLRKAIGGSNISIDDFLKGASKIPELMAKGQGSIVRLSETMTRQFFKLADGTVITVDRMNDVLKGAQTEGEKAAQALAKMGISAKTIFSGDVVAALREAAQFINNIQDAAQRAKAGTDVFGKDWEKIVDALLNGQKAAEGTAKAFRDLSATDVEKTVKLKAAWDDLAAAIRAVRDRIGALFLDPALVRAEWLTKLIDGAHRLFVEWSQLDEVKRKLFVEGLGEGPAETAFKILIALGQQLGGIWNDVLVPAGSQLLALFSGISAGLEGVTKSQVAAFFITAAIAAVGLAVALKGIGLALTPLSALIALVFSPFGAVLIAIGAAVVVFWDQFSSAATAALDLIPASLLGFRQAFQALFAGDFQSFWGLFAASATVAFATIKQAILEGHGVLNDFLRAITGEGVVEIPWVKTFVDGIKQIGIDLPGTIELIAKAFISLGNAATTTANVINKIFGTSLTGTDVAAVLIIAQLTGGLQAMASAATIAAAAMGILIGLLGLLATAVGGLPVAIGLLVIALGALIAFNWDSFKSDAVAAWDAITGAIGRAYDALLRWLGLRAQAGGTPLPGGAPIGGPGGGIGSNAAGGLLGGRGTGTSDSNLAWVSRGEHIMPASVVRQPGVLSFLEALRRGGGIPGFAAGGAVGASTPNSVIGPIFNRVIQLLRDADQAIFDTMTEFLQTVGRLDQSMAGIQNTIRRAADTLQQLNQRGGNAAGGLLGGRGTGTSDSNLAWVSRGEYITPAGAVSQPGVLAFLEALRRSGGNLRAVLDGMGRFALGGMGPRPAMAFARGGLAGSMSNVTIQFPGLPAIGGLRASSEVVEQLHKAAALAQVRSGGRKPSRYS